MSDKNNFKNPYLQGAQPQGERMDYRKIMDEYRARHAMDTPIGGQSDEQEGEQRTSRMALPELRENNEPNGGNRFSFDLKKEVAGDVDIDDLRSIRKVTYGDSYRPRKSGVNIRRNYESLNNVNSVSSREVRATINSSRRRRALQKQSPVSAPTETVEEKRARIEAMLPTPDEQKELDKIMEQRGKLYSTPSFMRDELKLEQAPSVNDTDIVTSLRTNLDLPGYSFRQRYMNQGLEDENITEIPMAPVQPEGFGGSGGNMPEFESEVSNWSLRPDEERFSGIEIQESYGVIPMGAVEDRHRIHRAKIRLGGVKTASAFETGAGSLKSSRGEQLARELASKKKRSRLRIARAIPAGAVDNAQTPERFTDISSMENQNLLLAKQAGIQDGIAIAQAEGQGNASPQGEPGAIWRDTAASGGFQGIGGTPQDNASLAPKSNTFTDGNFEKVNAGRGMINRQKSTYSYLFNEDEEIPENITNFQKGNYRRTGGQDSNSEYGYLFMNDEDIDNQISDSMSGKTSYVEPVGMSGQGGSAATLSKAVRDPITMTSFDAPEPESPESAKYKLSKGNISYSQLGQQSEGANMPINSDASPTQQGFVQDMPDAKRYAQGFSSLGDAAFDPTVAPGQSSPIANQPAQSRGFVSEEVYGEYTDMSVTAAENTGTAGSNVLKFTGSAEAQAKKEKMRSYEKMRSRLYEKIRDLIFSVGSNGAILAVLLVFELLPQLGVKLPEVLTPSTPVVYYGLSCVLYILGIIFFRKTVYEGFADMFSGKPTYKSYASIASVAVLGQMIAVAITAFSGGQAMRVYPSSLLLCLIIMNMGRLFRTMRIGRGLTFISSDKGRGALLLAGSHEGSHMIASESGLPSGSNVAYHAKAEELTDYEKYSNEEDLSERITHKLFWGIVAVEVIVAIVGGFVSGGFSSALTAFVLCSLLSMPFTAVLANNLPLSNMSKKLLRRGAMVVGWSAVDEFSDVNVVTMNGEELFPNGAVELVGIKTFGDKRIDRAILDAAAVTISLGGTLGDVFLNVIHGETNVLPEVDTPQYEEGFGISGWVKGRRILIGNRNMLEQYGVETPKRDYDKMYEQEGSKLVYLSSNGELSAMFVLKYHAEERTREQLRELADCGVNIAVRTSDVNITSALLSRTFGIRPEYISVLPQSLTPVVDNLSQEVKKEAPAIVCTNRSVSALATALSAVIKIKSSLVIAVVLQTMGMIVGLIFSLFLAATGACSDFLPVQVMLYSIIWTLAVTVVPSLKKIVR